MLSDTRTDEPRPIEDAARFLAAESMHPRYTATETGWKTLLDPASENNVHHAHAAALKAHPRADREYEQALAVARDELLRFFARRRAAGTEG